MSGRLFTAIRGAFSPRAEVIASTVWMSLLAAGLLALASRGGGNWRWGLTFLLAAGWNAVNLWLLRQAVLSILSPRRFWGRLLSLGLKVPVWYGVGIYLLLRWPWQPEPVVGGVSLVLLVLTIQGIRASLLAEQELK